MVAALVGSQRHWPQGWVAGEASKQQTATDSYSVHTSNIVMWVGPLGLGGRGRTRRLAENDPRHLGMRIPDSTSIVAPEQQQRCNVSLKEGVSFHTHIVSCILTKMATKKTAPTDDELLAQLDDLSTQATSRPAKPSARATRHGQPTQSSQSEQDLLAELGNLAQRPASRPATPSLRPNPPSTAGNRSPKRTSTATPPPGRTSEEKSSSGQRKSGDSTRSFHQSFTPATTTTEESAENEPQPEPAPAKSGGWWGGLLSTASAAVSQAQAAVKEIQKNEEAHKWAEQVRGNVGLLRGFGTHIESGEAQC